ncbi:hypothetical protein CBER1_10252 [Cercospora berteroae]|uniref:BHLH domain-containing protein n=1 Tax=Cercospora berteroae TaxID=357750 RepID=A0A2S6BYG3_9PEZI|nr:hypothetical protein CBER1_10252 [Cercospora berteroae]
MAAPESFDFGLGNHGCLSSPIDDPVLWCVHDPVDLLSDTDHAFDTSSWLLFDTTYKDSQDDPSLRNPQQSFSPDAGQSALALDPTPLVGYEPLNLKTIALDGTESENEVSTATGKDGCSESTGQEIGISSPQPKIESRRARGVPKSAHRKVEKKYRGSLTSCLQRLSAKLPTVCDQAHKPHQCPRKFQGLEITHKRTKSSIMKKALEYVEHLEKRCQLLEPESESEVVHHKARVEILEAKLKGLRSILTSEEVTSDNDSIETENLS